MNLFTKIVIALAVAGSAAAAQQNDKPFPAHRIAGNLFYVGSTEYASYLVTTPQGHILINSSFESTVPWIRSNIEKLGFRFTDVKILLTSHAHGDHVAGNALVQQLTGAKTMVMDRDVELVQTGGRNDFHYGNTAAFKPSRVDHVLHDGEQVRLGDAVLTAHLTPGHTKGCTTWTMKVTENGKTYDVVIVGSPNVNPGYKLTGNANYPEIATDFAHTFDILERLHCDIFLGAHGNYYGMEEKYARLQAHASSNPFVDPAGYRTFISVKRRAFEAELAHQRETKSSLGEHSSAHTN